MISIDEALRLVLTNLPPGRVEKVPFSRALGRVTAAALTADRDIPPFNRSAMDGYALRAEDARDAPVSLQLVGEVRAGEEPLRPVRPGEAMAIMTGAALPEGTDAVQMIELTDRAQDGDSVTIQKPVLPGENVARRGSEAAAGQVVLEKGHLIGPPEMAVLATFGCTEVEVWRRPIVALIATGNELVEVEQKPRAVQIRNSNAWSLSGQLRAMGLETDYLGIARDDRDDLRRRISEGLKRDVLIISGGVSVGEYDFVKEVFEELGVRIVFSRVAMKPGKPTVFARKDDRLVFGLPGNPVSTFVSFENFVRPALGRICGLAHPELPRISGELQRDMKQIPGRTAFLPAIAKWESAAWRIDPLPWKGSGDIIGFSRANAAVIFPGDRDFQGEGETVEAMLLYDYFLRG